MARNYRVSVNGKSYDVAVEEIGALSPAPAAPAPVPAAAPAAPVPAAAAPKPAAPAGAGTITSPMPGKIWKLPVREGDAVAEGQLVLVLEAMKMENEIFAPIGGMVTKISCKEGDSVNTGDVLLVIG
ncbi:MAG: biotin/lipoyl-binding protein [Synergistaceae bacterium]|nr:biotin/lipoyl-binding protein [Synergistaceae bacterium]